MADAASPEGEDTAQGKQKAHCGAHYLKTELRRTTYNQREGVRPSRIEVFSGNASSPETIMFGFQGEKPPMSWHAKRAT